MNTIDAEIFRRAVCFTLTMRKGFTNRRQGDISKVKETTADGGAERLNANRFKLSKKLIESPELDAIAAYQSDLYKWAMARSVPSFFKDGIYLVKNEIVPEFEAKLNEARRELAENLVPAFIAAYPAQIDAARIALNGQFRIDDYPAAESLPARIGIEWNWISFGVPENLPTELRQAEAEKIGKRFAEAEAEIMTALREGFAATLAHVADRLKTEPGEKPKVFRDTLFEDLTEFIGTFNARNLVNDAQLAGMVEQAKAILAKVDGGDPAKKARYIRETGALRENTANAFAEMRKAVDGMIGPAPARKFDFGAE